MIREGSSTSPANIAGSDAGMPCPRAGAVPQSRTVLAVSMLLSLSGCATPVGLSILGGGASAMISHNLGGSVSRTFTAPLPTVRQASLSALDIMGVAVEGNDVGPNGEAIRGQAADRSIEIEFERLGDNLTVMRATARKPGFLRDNATAQEVVSQTENALAVFVSETTVTARPPASSRTAYGPSAAGPIYILNLENIPVGSTRKPRPVPARLQEYALYTTESESRGRRTLHVNLGYFASEAEASAARKLALATFPNARVDRFQREQAVQAPPAGRTLPAPAFQRVAASSL